jgi:hypothetical protein
MSKPGSGDRGAGWVVRTAVFVLLTDNIVEMYSSQSIPSLTEDLLGLA